MVKLLSRGSPEPLCDAELAIRGDAANGVPFEATLKTADAHLAVELERGVMFLADSGQRYEGSIQNAFHAPQHGVLLRGALKQPRKGVVKRRSQSLAATALRARLAPARSGVHAPAGRQ